MAGRILIIDPVATNRITLKVKLSAARYDTGLATGFSEALIASSALPPDLVIVGVSGNASGAEAISRIKNADLFATVPVVAISTETDAQGRLDLLRAGAEDVIERPMDDAFLLARLRSLLRARDATEELRLRDGTNKALGFYEGAATFEPPARVAIVASDLVEATAWRRALQAKTGHSVEVWSPEEALLSDTGANGADALILAVDCAGRPGSALTILPELRSRKGSRHAAVLAVLTVDNPAAAVMALDLGASDVMCSGFDAAELALRLGVQVQRKRDADRLRTSVRDGLKLAMTDPLTGLFNRRYALPHLGRMAARAQSLDRGFAVMIADLDRFKSVNDTYGHSGGDDVLVEVARRLLDNLRSVDLVARLGGEEFLIAMPETSLEKARIAAERLCRIMREKPVLLKDGRTEVPVTMSIGIAMGPVPAGQTSAICPSPVEALLHAADQALYRSKSEGRDQVTVSRTAA